MLASNHHWQASFLMLPLETTFVAIGCHPCYHWQPGRECMEIGFTLQWPLCIEMQQRGCHGHGWGHVALLSILVAGQILIGHALNCHTKPAALYEITTEEKWLYGRQAVCNQSGVDKQTAPLDPLTKQARGFLGTTSGFFFWGISRDRILSICNQSRERENVIL